MLPDLDGKLCGYQRFAYTFSNFLFLGFILFCRLTVLINLLAIYVMQSFSRFKPMAEVSRIDSKARSIIELNIKLFKVRTASVSTLFMFCADLDLFAFAILS